MSTNVTLAVTREGRYWVGVPDGYPRVMHGAQHQGVDGEAQAIRPFMASGVGGSPVDDIVIDYVFTDVPVEFSDDIHQYRELATQRRELDRTLSDAG
jgi:hypothetical protein